MPDWLPWLQRAERFVRSTSKLAGRWGMQITIDPPLEPAEADRLDRVLPHGLPAFLRNYYLTASANAHCCFHWSPDEPRLAAMSEILPHQYSIYAGPKICAAAKLEEEQNGLIAWAEVFDDFGGFGPVTARTLRESVPFIPIANGDQLVLHVKANPEKPPLIYVSHDTDMETESPLIPISDSAEEFMTAWERIGYIGPEIWLLYPFIEDSPTKRLDTGSPLALQWRTFLQGLHLPLEG
jgi:hypothetical protein